MEVIVTTLSDHFGTQITRYLKRKEFLVLVVCVVSFLCGLPNITQVGLHRYILDTPVCFTQICLHMYLNCFTFYADTFYTFCIGTFYSGMFHTDMFTHAFEMFTQIHFTYICFTHVHFTQICLHMHLKCFTQIHFTHRYILYRYVYTCI